MSQIKCITYRRQGSHISYEERLDLEKLLDERRHSPKDERKTNEEIIELMGISRSTFYRELKRGTVTQVTSEWEEYKIYAADYAQDNYEYHAQGKGPDLKIGKDRKLAEHIEEKIIHEDYSPDAVIMDLENTNHSFSITLSTKTIYNYIDKGVFQRLTSQDLPREGKTKKRSYQRVRRRRVDSEAKKIEDRPDEVEDRKVFGHWEMDCIESGKKTSKTALLTLVERVSRKTLMVKLTSQSQAQVLKALNLLEEDIGTETFKSVFKTITVDNGGEFLDWRSLEKSSLNKELRRTAIYYCHPYSSYERGTNENINGHIRRRIPKGSDIGDFTAKEIKETEQWVNNYPRRILKGKRANDIFEEKIIQVAT